MKATVNSALFQTAIGTVAPSTSARTSLPVLGGILLTATPESLVLSATNLDTAAVVEIEADVQQTGRTVVSAERLSAIAQRFPAAEASLKLKDQHTLSLSSGRTRLDLRGMDYADFPALPEVTDEPLFVLAGRDFAAINSRVAFAVAPASEVREGMKGVGLFLDDGKVRAVATNGRQLSELLLPAEGAKPGGEMLVHPSSLERIGKMFEGDEPVRASRSDNHLSFRAAGRLFICRLMGDTFPEYREMLKKMRAQMDRWMEADRMPFMSMIQRMQIVAAAVDISPVRLALLADRLRCYTATPDAGEAEEEMEVDRDGQDCHTFARTDMLLETLRRVPGPRVRVEMTGNMDQAMFFLPADAEPGGMTSTLMLMPLKSGAPQVAGWKPVG